jgi:hypothetical protein
MAWTWWNKVGQTNGLPRPNDGMMHGSFPRRMAKSNTRKNDRNTPVVLVAQILQQGAFGMAWGNTMLAKRVGNLGLGMEAYGLG